MASTGALLAANGPNSWVWWDWIGRHGSTIYSAVREHVVLTALAVGIGLLLSLPLGLLAWRWRWLESPVLGVTGVLYTIPSLALFALLVPVTGLGRMTAEIGLVSYTLLILVRNIVAGLDAVPPDVREAARGMGFTPARQLIRIDLPLALPAIVAGIRIATVTTIGLVTVTALIGQGGLGQLILDGLGREFHTPLVVGAFLSVALAAVADLSLIGIERLLTPWSQARARVV
ncbi:MAG: osmoprotectant transport system permease protein [Acidimicrobiaceae bacterium]|nr:osmoprotectant transport system permease protein [Acidimicrobiaceae bacterium]